MLITSSLWAGDRCLYFLPTSNRFTSRLSWIAMKTVTWMVTHDTDRDISGHDETPDNYMNRECDRLFWLVHQCKCPISQGYAVILCVYFKPDFRVAAMNENKF